MFITKKHLAAANLPARAWASAWRCRCSTRWCRRARCWRRRAAAGRDAARASSTCRTAPIMDKWTPAADGRRLRVHADPEAAGAVPGPAERGHRPRPPGRRHHRRALAQPDHLAERRAAQGHAGRGRLRRHHRRSDCRAGHRPGLVAAVDGAGHRGPLGPDRLVRPRLRLHLHEHAVVAHADDAAADGDQPAQGLRADVRPGRQRRRARGADPGGPQHPGRDRQGSRRPAAAARAVRSPDDDAVPGQRARDRAPHPARGEGAGRRGAGAARRVRPACRSTSRSTCG